MKKNKLFESEINEFVAGKSVVNCLRNRKARKVMAESVSEEMSLIDMFDERFKYRSDLRKMANDTTKEAYMIIRKEFGDSMWRQLGMDDCDERGLIGLINDHQEYYNMTDPQEIVDIILGRKSIRSLNKAEEQEEYLTAYDNEDPVWMVINVMRKRGMLRAKGMSGAKGMRYDDGLAIDAAYDLIEQKIEEGSYVYDEEDARNFVKNYGKEIAEKAMKSGIHNKGKSVKKTEEQEEYLTAYDNEDPVWMVINVMRKYGMFKVKGTKYDDGLAISAAYDLIEQKLDEDDVVIYDKKDAVNFVVRFGREIAHESMKSGIHNKGKSVNEQEEEKTKLSKSEMEDLAFRLADYLCESFIILEDQDEQYADLLAAVEKILKEDVPNPESMRDCYNWCDRWYKKIEGLTYSYYNDPNPLSYYEEQEEDQVEDVGEPWEIHYPTEKELKEIARLEKVTVDDIFETEICDHYMSALETGDYSGLDEQDERLLDEWCLKYRYLWPLTQNDGEFPEASFGECDVCGMAGNVVPVLCVQRKRKEEQEQFSISKKRGYSISDVYPDSRWGEKERLNGPNGMSKVERDMLLKFETVVPKLVKKAMNKVKGHSDPETIKKMVLGMIKRGDLFSKIGGKVGAEWNELSAGFRRELINLVKDTFAEYNKQA